MIGWLVRAALGPVLSLGSRYLDNQKDRARLEAGVTKVAYETDAAVRSVKLSHLLGRLPLFVAEVTCAVYIGSIFVDSTWPMQWLTPLELPRWFQDSFYIIVASIFGIAAVERRLK